MKIYLHQRNHIGAISKGECVGAPAPPFWSANNKGKKNPKFMQQIFRNVEICGKRGKKIKKGKKF